ncbi:MAG: hypothetical protein QUS13_15005 [Smithella sp.]|nr:hypothetical protein [Smithella sp.]
MHQENNDQVKYLAIGFKALRLKGYHPDFNPQGDYKTAKQPVDKGFTEKDFNGLTIEEIEKAEKQGFWIGWLVPAGYIIIDSENPEVIKSMDAIAQMTNCSVQKTNRGKQYLFRCNDKDIPASSEYFCAGGYPVTPRVAEKNYVIMPSTNGRTWECWTEPDKLPELPIILLPHDKENKKQVSLRLAWTVGEEYRKGNLAGWEDIDAAFMAYLIERGLDIDSIHECFRLVFRETYDYVRTEAMYGRAKNLKENGKRLIGSGSFVRSINNRNLNSIRRFLVVVDTCGNQSTDLDGKQRRPSIASELIRIAEPYHLFNDRIFGYAWINNEVLRIQGSAFRQFITNILFKETGQAAGTEAINRALNIIEGKALFEGDNVELHNRLANYQGSFYYDMGNGRAVKITAEGWTIDNSPPILFKRHAHQIPQIDPERGGTVDKIFDFMNIMNPYDRLLLAVILVALFIPDIIHPLFYFRGGQGSGKTKAADFIKQLVDPSKLEVFMTPQNKTELIQTMQHHYLCVFDNVSFIPDWFSDVLSTSITGGGQSKRKLYTDDEDVIFSFKRCVAMTAINLCITRSDLLDRSIIIGFRSIDPTQRKEESKMIAEFEAEKPRILGAIFDALSTAMRIYPHIRLNALPRMADFCRWGCAIAEALGYDQDEFLDTYYENIHEQHDEIISGNTLAQAIIKLMRGRPHWFGLVGDLYDELKKLANVSREDKTFPSHSNKLRAHIERIKPNLLEAGIDVDISPVHCEDGTPVTIRNNRFTITTSCTQNHLGEVTQTLQ